MMSNPKCKQSGASGTTQLRHRTPVNRPSMKSGYSMVELIVVIAIVGIATAFAIPQLAASRRLNRSVAVTRELMTQMRYARQLAMSNRQAYTFSFDNVAKTIRIIDSNTVGSALLLDANYPLNSGSSVVATIPLNTGGLSTNEFRYGIPSGLPTTALGDGVSRTPLTANRFNVTFQPDGSVINSAGNPSSAAMFIYNSAAPNATASAISVLGTTGRIKVWRYSSGVNKYSDY